MPKSHLSIILANIITLNPNMPSAKAVLVGAGRVLGVGSSEEMRAIAPKADIIDHRDLILTPGMCDAHIHLVTHGFAINQLRLHGTLSVNELKAKLSERVLATPYGEWIVGCGFLLSEMGLSGYPQAGELDEVSPNHPVMLYSRDLHMIWVNTLALRVAGITEDTPDPPEGKIIHPLGVFLENATELISSAVPVPTEQMYLEAARAASKDMFDRGYVSAHTMAFESETAPRALQTLANTGELQLRVWACLPHDRLGYALKLGLAAHAGGMFQWGGVKFFADGALGSRSALLHEPGFADKSGTGIALDSPELIYQLGLEAISLGLTPVTHAIGDRANSEVLNVYERLRPAAQKKGILLRIEHNQHLRPEDIPRYKGFVASGQPIHLPADAASIRSLLPHLAQTSYAFKSLKEAGAILAFGSDSPVAPPDHKASFAAATTRIDDQGLVFGQNEVLSELDVLWAHTRGPALAANWQDEGVIKEGARAAFTLWDKIGGNARAFVF